jgi:hypothetical protein
MTGLSIYSAMQTGSHRHCWANVWVESLADAALWNAALSLKADITERRRHVR